MNSLDNPKDLKENDSNKRFFENLWTVSDVSEFLRLPPKTIYSWVHQQKIPYLKLGNRLRFRSKEIEKWLSNKGGY